MPKVIGVITARMGSTRFPGKVMKKIMGKSIFAYHVERLKSVDGLSGIFLATSRDPRNRELIVEAERLGCGWYVGEEEDVIDRHIKLCKRESADAIIRMLCDEPFVHIDSASIFVSKFKSRYQDYIYPLNISLSLSIILELISYKALLKTHRHYQGPALALYILENMDKFKTLGVPIEDGLNRPEYRLKLDYKVDFELIRRIYEVLYKGKPLCLHEVYCWLDNNPQVAKINRDAEESTINKYAMKLEKIIRQDYED